MTTPPPSASQLAQQLGDDLLDPTELPASALELAAAARDLVSAVVATDMEPNRRAGVAEQLRVLTRRLRRVERTPAILLGRHADGRVENLTQAGSGRLNPQALPLVFDPVDPPEVHDEPVAVEVTGRCRLDDAHGGPPERAHGGVVATLLDETIGLAATLAGGRGLTAGMTIHYRAATPLHTELVVGARLVRSDGRKHVATGEITVDGEVTADAEGVFISPRPHETEEMP